MAGAVAGAFQGAVLAGIACYLPAGRASVSQLAAAGALESSAAVMEGFGFGQVHVAAPGEGPAQLARAAAERLLRETGVERESIGALAYAAAIPPSAMVLDQKEGDAASHGALLRVESVGELFKYPAARLQHELGLPHATLFGVNQLGCAALFGAVRLARALLAAEPDLERVLCLSADCLPPAAPREVMYSLISDGACALLVERATLGPARSAAHGARYRIVDYYQATKGYYWDGDALRDELIASYFPTARAVVAEALRRAALTLAEVDWIVPHNVSRRSWDILAGVLGFPRHKIFDANIAAKGHLIAADNFVNLADMEAAGLVLPGQRLLLFTFGFGATWATILLERLGD